MEGKWSFVISMVALTLVLMTEFIHHLVIQILFITIESLPKWKTVLILISLLLQLLERSYMIKIYTILKG